LAHTRHRDNFLSQPLVEFTQTTMRSDLAQLIGAVLLILAALMPVVNPVGGAPFFLAMTKGCDAKTRSYLAQRIAVYSFGLLLGSMLLGSFVLRLFGLTIPIVQVAGGAVVCSVGWNLLTEDRIREVEVTIDPSHARSVALRRVFYPLTLPVTIDAGVISVAITLGAHHVKTVERSMVQLVAAILGSSLVALAVLLAYRFADPFGKRVGETGMTMMLRLSAFIALCVGVGICWSGIKSLLLQVGIHSN
jgi:multiple antibiotic resistance protein